MLTEPVAVCKFHTVLLWSKFKIDTFALAHLRGGLLLSQCILNSFREQNGSLKRYQKFYNRSQLQYSFSVFYTLDIQGFCKDSKTLTSCQLGWASSSIWVSMMVFTRDWSFLNRFFIVMLKQSAAQSYLPGAEKKKYFFEFFYVHSATNREGALWLLQPSSSANTHGDLKQNWLLFYRISLFMHL